MAQSVQYIQHLGGKNVLDRMVVAPEVQFWMEESMRNIRELVSTSSSSWGFSTASCKQL